MKNIFSLLLLALSTTAIAQPETPPAPLSFEEMQLPPVREPEMYRNIADQLMGAINQDPNMIMGSTDEELHKPENKFPEYLKEIKKEYGNMQEKHFMNMTGSIARYDAAFDKNRKVLMKVGVTNEGKLSFLSFSKFNDENEIPALERNTTKLSLPFTGEWYVLSGGIADVDRQSTSFENRGAVTFTMRGAQKKAYKTNGSENADYYAFGQPIIAPCDATIAKVIDNINDNEPGSINNMFAGGNTIILKTDKAEYIVLGHLKDGSIKVKQGDKVKKGAALAECGNSGNSKQPSLFFNVQNTDGSLATIGGKAIFSNVTSVMPDGKTETKESYTPIKGSSIKAK
jgi:hypothetical protein